MFAIVNGEEIQEYYGKPYVEISKKPFFSEDLKRNEFCVKTYRIGSFNIDNTVYPIYAAYACIDKDHISGERNNGNNNKNMPAFFNETHKFIKGKYLYNNCHLIGYQLSGVNSKENFIIGTRYMNEIGMFHFEVIVKDYVKNTGNHVLYRVTPVFNENEQLIRGVQMEAFSVEDDGKEICFNVFVYNVQPGVAICYKCGSSKEDKEWCDKIFSQNKYTEEEKGTQDYILNTGVHIFHNSNCEFIDKINDENKKEFKYPRQFLKDNGYKPCNNCNP